MGDNYRSGFERTLATQLKASKIGFKFEPYKIDYTINHTYLPDFVLDNGIVIEAKGFFRAGDTAKYRTIKNQNPGLDLRFVFFDGDKKISGQKTTHGQWAERYNFPWATGRIPQDWLTQ